jgi:hypothetical protein
MRTFTPFFTPLFIDIFIYLFFQKKNMKAEQEHMYVLFIVGIVGLFALGAILSYAIKLSPVSESDDLTGAAVITHTALAQRCTTAYYDTIEQRGVTQYAGSQFMDYCYDDKAATEPTNNGRYLREYGCFNNEVSVSIHDCGANKCQFGACI